MQQRQWQVRGTKKGGWPVVVEKRKNHKVTVIRNVEGDGSALVTELKGVLGAGGVARGGEVEIQGDHEARVVRFLTQSGQVKGVSSSQKPDGTKGTKGSNQSKAQQQHGQQQQQQVPLMTTTSGNGSHMSHTNDHLPHQQQLGHPKGLQNTAAASKAVKQQQAIIRQMQRGANKGGGAAQFHGFVSLMKTWFYWDHDYSRFEELWEERQKQRANSGAAWCGAGFLEDEANAAASAAASRGGAEGGHNGKGGGTSLSGDAMLREMGMIATPVEGGQNRAERLRLQRARDASSKGAGASSSSSRAAPGISTRHPALQSGGLRRPDAPPYQSWRGAGAPQADAAPPRGGPPPKPYTAAWYAAMASGREPSALPQAAPAPHPGRGAPAPRSSSSSNGSIRNPQSMSHRRSTTRRKQGAQGPRPQRPSHQATRRAQRRPRGPADSSDDEDQGEYMALDVEHYDDYSASGAHHRPGQQSHGGGSSLADLIEGALSWQQQQPTGSPSAPDGVRVLQPGHIGGAPHVSCSDLWGDLTEEQALDLALRLSREQEEAQRQQRYRHGGAGSSSDGSMVDDAAYEEDQDEAAFRREMEAAMALSSQQQQQQQQLGSEEEDDELRAAMELSQKTAAAEAATGTGGVFSAGWWMAAGQAEGAADTLELTGSNDAVGSGAGSDHDGDGGGGGNSAELMQGGLDEDEALRLAMQRSMLETGASSRAEGCNDAGGHHQAVVTAEALVRRLGVVIGDDDEENSVVVMEFLMEIRSEQGVRDYLEEVLLERGAADEAAWDELGPLPRDIAQLNGWHC